MVLEAIVKLDAVGREKLPLLKANQLVALVGFVSLVVRLLDGSSRRRKVAGNGQAKLGAIGQVYGHLHQAFSEGPSPYDQPAVIVLDGSCQNLRSRSGALVDQYDHGSLFKQTWLGSVSLLAVLTHLSLLGNDQISATKQFISHVDGRTHITARIPLQVNDELLHALGLEFCH